MKVKFWGVRGSIPVPGPDTVRYGGNTSCVSVTGRQGECIIIDGGTGLRPLGNDLTERFKTLPPIHILVSHTHWDHIQGFPFFTPCYIPGTRIHVRGPVHYMENRTLQDLFDIQMQYEFFPISNCQLDADITYDTVDETSLTIGGVAVKSQFTNHPVRCLAYRLTENGRSVVYACDHEPYFNVFQSGEDSQELSRTDDDLFGGVDTAVADANQRFVDFIKDTDLYIADAQFTPEEYPSIRRNWGHSSWDYCLDWMIRSGTGRMVLTHHDPLRTDDQLDEILKNVRAKAKEKGINPSRIITSKEGMEITV